MYHLERIRGGNTSDNSSSRHVSVGYFQPSKGRTHRRLPYPTGRKCWRWSDWMNEGLSRYGMRERGWRIDSRLGEDSSLRFAIIKRGTRLFYNTTVMTGTAHFDNRPTTKTEFDYEKENLASPFYFPNTPSTSIHSTLLQTPPWC